VKSFGFSIGVNSCVTKFRMVVSVPVYSTLLEI
jgi:hypothetical protein